MMKGLDAAEILEVWEHGAGRPQWQQALLLASRAARPLTPAEAARLEIGERDRLILGLREKTLKQPLRAVAQCPSCKQAVEFSIPAGELGADPDLPPRKAGSHAWRHGRFRLPTTEDLASAGSKEALFERCCAGAPAEALDEWEGEIERRDPLADVVIDLECGACHHQWQAPFDATSFFWRELEAAAKRLLREVDELAARYGWTEEDVLKLSARRRRMYLELEPRG